MTEEEKKITKRLKDDIALVTFNDNLNYGIGNLYVNINDLKIILNLISKLQANIEIKDKVIEKTCRYINEAKIMNKAIPVYPNKGDTPYTVGVASIEEIKQHFYKKAEEEK